MDQKLQVPWVLGMCIQVHCRLYVYFVIGFQQARGCVYGHIYLCHVASESENHNVGI